MNKKRINTNYKNIIKKIKQARIESGLSQDIVAKNLKKYASYISKIEHGDRKIDVLELVEFANIYNKDIKYFFE